MLRLGVALGVVLLLLPLAARPVAAELGLVVDAPAAVMEPLTPATVGVHATVDCQAVLARSVGGDVQMSLTLDAPAAYAIVTGSQGTMPIDPATCQGGSASTTVDRDYQLTLLHEAPGLTPIEVTVTAALAAHATDDLTGGPRQAEEGFTVSAAAVVFSEVQSPVKLKQCGCPVTFDLDVTNFGNVPTRYEFALAPAPAVPVPTGSFVLPAPFELAPSTAGSTSTGTGKVVFQAPADTWSGEFVFTVLVTSSAVGDPASTGEPRSVSLLVRNVDDPSAFDKATPGSPPALLVLALAALASIAARRRA